MRISSEAFMVACALVTGVHGQAIAAANAMASGGAGATRVIVQLRASDGSAAAATPADRARALDAALGRAERARQVAERRGVRVQAVRAFGTRMVALRLETPADGTAADLLAALRADPDVEFADIDYRRSVRAVPTDPRYAGQWYLQGVETAATNFQAAWDTTTGSPGTVIAVLDTGVVFAHPDLDGRLLPGYDFVSGESSSSFASANDGDDWDDDAADPGDWVSLAESQSGPLRGCRVEPSSWHGTRVAAMVGAETDNGDGIAGGTWQGGVLPVRVLGKCGGYDSDIIAGMLWAGGLPVAGVPANPNPASIINLSLGSADPCSSAYIDAIADLADAGVLVVASAGNDSGPVEAPANCPGALAVAGLRHVGTKVGYSSLGPEVAISAPAGNCPELDTTFLCSYSLVTATDTGQTTPLSPTYTDDVDYNIGTSFSAPIVAAVAGLMHAVNANLTPAEVTARLQAGSRPFPPAEAGLPTCPSLDASTGQCNCTTTTCGAGILDAAGAVNEALRPMARVVGPAGSGAGQDVTLNGSTSAAAPGRTLAAYAWSGVSGNPQFVGATNEPTVTVAVPDSGEVKVRLRVTDDLGRTDTRDVTLGEAPGGGGGGAFHPAALLLLLVARGLRRRDAGRPS
jgi:serine protease